MYVTNYIKILILCGYIKVEDNICVVKYYLIQIAYDDYSVTLLVQ